jgi:2-enoate reductase
MPDGCYIEEASKLSEVLDIPVICPGKLSDPVLAEKALEEGKIDALSMGRQLVADPYWPIKVKTGKLDEIRPCLYCNNGCLARVLGGMPMACAVNADLFAEREQHAKYAKVATPKKIAIIGGGVAGLEAARVAATRGHNVTIYEKEDHLGGLMIPGEVPEFKKEVRRKYKAEYRNYS